MDTLGGLDLGALLSQLQTTQQARSSAKLSERNVIELVNKLKQLGILGEAELLHTINGKEYLTQDGLKAEVASQLRAAGGRVALVELPALLGVDSVHCERQAAAIAAESRGEVVEVQGELIATYYFDAIAAEINEQLHEGGQLRVGELAAQYGLATELIVGVINARLGAPGGIDGAVEGWEGAGKGEGEEAGEEALEEAGGGGTEGPSDHRTCPTCSSAIAGRGMAKDPCATPRTRPYPATSPPPGRLEGGLLYTPAYLRNVKAQLRGALRATTAPLLLGGLLKVLLLLLGHVHVHYYLPYV